ncbi:ribonuclease P protein subunit p40 isoform X2 [Dendroctonus ponderosae]|uniref:ribonuclease P protein subunit p40 isoform X2 n=1 Tax=Dendroctonus ponderosae TaxID=77166 RepID=UPI002035B8CD|nr:ribonuclease P protein subunit p40 isoform X2 [Dendroctonus ponderosae]
MQNPEVWSFSEPQPSFNVQRIGAAQLSLKQVEKFHFNHLVSVVLPDSFKLPDQFANVLVNDCEYYKILDLNLAALLGSKFRQNFIKKGKLILLSIGTRIDCDNCCAITPTGSLILSLTKDSYQRFGLDGKVSHFTKRNKDRYIVTIDLTDPKLVPEKPFYKRTRAALQSLEKFNVIINWEAHEESVCPSSVAKFFFDIGYKVKLCAPKFQSHIVYSVNTPTLDEATVEESDVVDFVEWLGMVCLDGHFSEDLNAYANQYTTPEPNVALGQVRTLQWRGFFHSHQIMKLIDYVREFNQNQDKLWSAVYVQGFSDAPVIEAKEEQSYYTNGDNGNICIFKKSHCWFCKFRRCAKQYK